MKKEVIIGKGKTMGVQIFIMSLKSRLRIIGWFDNKLKRDSKNPKSLD